jgi:hypothetical protein
MKKVISVIVTTVMFAVFSISIFGKTLPSVGYVLVGPKKRWWMVNAALPRI